MYNLRYHIASLVAVFLALAIGLLLGTVVAERGMITDRSTALVQDLQRRFDEISATNQELRVGLDRDRAFAEDLVPLVTRGVLSGRNVVTLVGKGRVDGLNAVNASLAQAGATAAVVSLERPGLGLADSAPQGLVGYFARRGERMAEPGPALTEQVAHALASEWRTSGPRPLTGLLAEAGLVGVDGLSDTTIVEAVVIMAAHEGKADPFAIAVGHAMKEANGVVVGAEAGSSESGVAISCAGEGFSSVGHLETVQGRFSLVWLLAERATGVYGTQDGAEGYYPAISSAD